ncbi:hypothetical protein BWD42_07700 [Sphingobacterium sp. CZ-UAM]|uniref:hypothetical protein n=1 Tax=Sphingobacterium sp. CZ-UAM TaxID=1933868 RepID=UPI000985A034|nr:hypothetical protein [Sphingobacterium sp. CZ-UAM]OOG19775.1 hypothetical protein BWD42_07700 [Sphingobacterium sp. CZ-UAM]
MRQLKTYNFLCLSFLLLAGTNVFAQKKWNISTSIFAQDKMSKKMKEAVEVRISSDKWNAEVQRITYEKEEWKNSWMGAKISDLYKKWGAPTRSAKDENGEQVLEYETVSYSRGGCYTPGYSITTYYGFGNVLDSKTVQGKDTRYTNQTIHTTRVYTNKAGIITELKEESTYNRL